MNSESDFHISTDNDFSHLLQLSKKFQPMEMAGPLREITFDFITHEDIDRVSARYLFSINILIFGNLHTYPY